MSNPKTTIPTLSNWGEIESRNYYNGVEVCKVNKTSIRPRDGAQPLFHYVNKAQVKGDWYNVEDVVRVDKVMQAENKRFANDLHKKLISGELDPEQKKAIELLMAS